MPHEKPMLSDPFKSIARMFAEFLGLTVCAVSAILLIVAAPEINAILRSVM